VRRGRGGGGGGGGPQKRVGGPARGQQGSGVGWRVARVNKNFAVLGLGKQIKR